MDKKSILLIQAEAVTVVLLFTDSQYFIRTRFPHFEEEEEAPTHNIIFMTLPYV